ncbi:MAG: YabP/YqfC family sporulation protein [Clostridia bacterium]|jgi:sporulation protein YabP|nr:YabP/YqfC family sporulation protein [Clostridia bacterium]MDD3862646.1 YabP/YqfC family sporulation protein [Clostridia bacterium]MDD4408248.1 YabP/YqfC family sporulation protein [Clostridia bacterium]
MDRILSLINQNSLSITGVEKVKNVNPNEIIIEIDGQMLIISGTNLEVQTLDLENSTLVVNGLITCIKYSTKKPSFFKRIFK